MTYPYRTLPPEHREQMAAWLEDGIQPANTTLRAALEHSTASLRIQAGQPADAAIGVRWVCEWLYDNAPAAAWGYEGALQSWPRALAVIRQRRKAGVPG
jgi:hypothetical protein